jgi:RimJ/RimL family protein N-acetyltransferase
LAASDTADVLELRTERLLLRRWRPRDAEPMVQVNRDPEVTRHLNRPMDEVAAAGFFDVMVDHWERYGFGPWALESLEPDTSGRFVGFAGLLQLPPFLVAAGSTPELAWRLGRSFWGRGLATEASLAARDDALGRLALPELISVIHPDNQRSQSVATKLGMQPVRSIENPVLGRDVDVWALADRAGRRLPR